MHDFYFSLNYRIVHLDSACRIPAQRCGIVVICMVSLEGAEITVVIDMYNILQRIVMQNMF